MDIEQLRKSACVAPILYVSDIAVSFDYYVDRLKFTKLWDWGEPPSFGGVGFGDNVELFFCQQCQGHPGSWLSIFIKDVDAYAGIIRPAGTRIVREPISEPWNVREMHVQDPDGHIIRFGTGIEC